MNWFIFIIAAFLSWPSSLLLAKASETIEFRADRYERDLKRKVEKGSGKAWFRSGEREIWADEIELDRQDNKAIANGNVHLREKNIDIFCNRAIYSLDGTEAILEEAVFLSGQMVVTGSRIKKLGPERYEITEGVYTNCNTIPVTDKTAGRCLFDWKIYAHKFDLTLDGYVYAYDVIIYSKDLPLSYLPVFIAPAKAKRQTGILLGSVTSSNHLGTGVSLPFFWAMAPWQDLTLTPTYFSKVGFHLATEYNYVYSDFIKGGFSLFWNEKPFNALRANPEFVTPPEGNDPNNPSFIQKKKLFGFAGELALALKNTARFSNGLFSQQTLNYVSDPFYVQDYPNDIGLGKSNLGYLRSLFTVTYPSEQHLFYGGLIHHQSLLVATDSPPTHQPEKRADRGSLTQLPKIGAGQKLTELLSPYLAFEWDTHFTHFWRPDESYDNNIPLPGNTEITPEAPYQDGDFIREGERFQFEPRAIAQIPLPKGFELQPMVKASLYGYQFNLPEPSTTHRVFATAEVPFSFYLSKTFRNNDQGSPSFSHLIQPRLIYGTSLFRNEIPSHPFFKSTHPTFDVTDLAPDFEYVKIELIQRFRKIINNESVRFITFQLSNQYNSRLDRNDPRFFDPSLKHRLGPLQGYLNLDLQSFSAVLEGYYQWEKDTSPSGEKKNESSWSATLNYSFSNDDRVTVSGLFRNALDSSQDEELITLGVNKALPVFLNLSAQSTYSMKRGELRSYEWGAHFASKPTSCWSLSVLSGRTQAQQTYARFVFQLNFGGSIARNP